MPILQISTDGGSTYGAPVPADGSGNYTLNTNYSITRKGVYDLQGRFVERVSVFMKYV